MQWTFLTQFYRLGNFHPPIVYIKVRVFIWKHHPLWHLDICKKKLILHKPFCQGLKTMFYCSIITSHLHYWNLKFLGNTYIMSSKIPMMLGKNLQYPHIVIQYTLGFWNHVQYSHMGHKICIDIWTKSCNTYIQCTKYVLVYWVITIPFET
jgi:hypothetical protein